ncbi:MAG TPA: ATP phosphoribosyltransferase regulatory subunit, partial [Gammaproteobacteria bacterium]|nr:ATP phosphoribosyltransferase regulatory subunit [Gammaproteobacteria bacterium]
MTSSLERWRLPDGVEELLPAEVAHIETLRRKVLDLFHSWGYETVIPPLIEYLESLLTGAGNDLDLQTFKLTDQLTGRMMGVRADMTPQVARIDAHRLNREGPTRLCYLGSVLHTRPEISGATRSPIQVGAELYGHATIESDLEVIRLMLEMVKMAGHSSLVLDLGHVGIYRGLIEQAG